MTQSLRIDLQVLVKYFPLWLFTATLHFLYINGWCQDTTWMVGAAQRSITPQDSAFIAGHTNNRRFTGVNDPLFVKAVAIGNGGLPVILLTFDCIGLLYPELQDIRRRADLRFPGISSDRIIMTSTHTHSGPDVVGLWGKDRMHSGVDPGYMEFLIDSAVDIIALALSNMQPARAEFGEGQHGDDWVFNISQPPELDRSLTVLRFFDQNHRNIATLVNFACHPTFLDAVNNRVSSDYVGGYYAFMDSLQSGINLFLQGAIGGWVQPEYELKTHAQAFFRGGELASKAHDLLKKAKPLKGTNLRFRSIVFSMPVENEGFKMLSRAGVIRRVISDSVSTEIAVFNIGEAYFATHPGETVPQLSIRTKSMMKTDGPKFVLGLGMDALGYILKPEFFDPGLEIPHSTYLCSVSVGPQTERFVFNYLKKLMTDD